MAGNSLIKELELQEIINTFDYSRAQPWIISHFYRELKNRLEGEADTTYHVLREDGIRPKTKTESWNGCMLM